MRSFPGQLTAHGLNACSTFVWTLAPFYVQVFLSVKAMTRGLFVVDVP